MNQIEGSIALVTGANRGLGQALVSALLEAGAAKIYAAVRDEQKLTHRDPRVVPLTLDLTRPQSSVDAAKKAGDVRLLINNAGIMTAGNVLGARRADLDADFETNVHGTLSVIKAFVPVLERAPAGATIVNVLSLVSLASLPALGGYSASKAAAYSVTQALRAELRPKGIAVLAALPALIDTDMVRHLPAPKNSPAATAQGVIAGIARGDEEIFPDPQAKQLGALWNQNHKEYERVFASF